MKRKLLSAACACAVMLLTLPGIAQIKGDPKLKGNFPKNIQIEKPASRLSPELRDLYESRNPARRKQDVKPTPANPSLRRYMKVSESHVAVDVTIKSNYAIAKKELDKLGFRQTAAFGRVISGVLPIDALPRLESARGVKFVRPAFKPVHQGKPLQKNGAADETVDNLKASVVPVISQGDTAQRSYLARQKSGRSRHKVDGSGVKVGIISDSYNNLGSAAKGVRNGELPGPDNPLHYKKPVQVLKDLDSAGTDEGRAMAEVVHDVAPGAELAFHTALGGEAAMAQGVLDLARNGCKVIVDDVTYLTEPFFQDGIIAQAVNRVKQYGISYFAAAGNRSVRSYESEYRATMATPLGPESGTAHNFSGPGDPPRHFQPIFLPTNGELLISFQWDDPFFSAGGRGAESDLDIYLFDENGSIVSVGGNANIVDGDPVEVFSYTNNTRSNTFYLLILKFRGPDPTRLKYIFYGDEVFYLTDPGIPGILAPSLIGHAKAEGALATAAALYSNTPAYGLDTPQVEFFSGVGGVANYFDLKGNRTPPVVRRKPEITAPDGGNSSFFPSTPDADITADTDPYPNFFGTSAAAPHAAAVAALMIDAQKLRTITPDQIKGILGANTIDMDNIYTEGFDEGFDFNTGTGLIKADAAVNTVRFPNLYVRNLDLRAVCSDDPGNNRNWELYNPNPFAVKAVYFIVGGANGSIVVPPGIIRFSTRTLYHANRPARNILIANWEDNFGFPRFDIAGSSRAVCNRNMATQDAGDDPESGVITETPEALNTAEVYPNPSSTHFRLYLSLADPKKIDISLFSIDGKQLYNKVAQANGIFDIDASGYRPGVYILKVRQGEFSRTIKLVKK